MPSRSSSHRRGSATYKGDAAEGSLPAYNGYGQTTLPVHSKDAKAAELAAATEPGSNQLVVAFRGTYEAPPPPVEDAETKAVRVAQQLVDATVFANQEATETRDKFNAVNQLLADDPSLYHQQLANDAWVRHVTAANHAQKTYRDSLEAVKVADKIKAENTPVSAYGGDYLAPVNTEERTEEEWNRMEAELVRREEQALDAYDLADQDVAKKQEAYMVLVLQAEIGRMDSLEATGASYNVSQRDIEHAGAALTQARDAARRFEEKAEIAIEQTRRFRETVEAARTGYGGTRQARASACYYEGEWRKIDGGALCPQCLDVCTYQLSCPDCGVNTCRRCLKECRLRFPHNKGKMARTALAKRREA